MSPLLGETTEEQAERCRNMESWTYGGDPMEVKYPLSKIVGYRKGICKGCEWHPDVCVHCKNSLHPGNNPEFEDSDA